MATTTDVSPLKINYLTQSQYNTALANNQINANELYLTPADDTVNISIATNTVAGIVKPWYYHSAASSGPTTGNNSTAVTVNGITTDAGKYYAVEMDKDGRMFVNVPWTYTNTKNTAGSTDTSSKIYLIGATEQSANPQTYSHDTAYVGTDGCLYSGGSKVLTAHQTYTSFTGKPTANQTPGFGSTFTIQQISQATSGQVSGTDRTVTIPDTIATNTAIGLVKPWYNHTVASTGPTAGSNATAVTVNEITTYEEKYYAVEMDKAGRMFVNVPWINTAVTQNSTTTDSWNKILLTYSGSVNSSTGAATNNLTNVVYYNNNIAVQPSTGTIRANIYRVQDNVELQWNSTDESLDFIFV